MASTMFRRIARGSQNRTSVYREGDTVLYAPLLDTNLTAYSGIKNFVS